MEGAISNFLHYIKLYIIRLLFCCYAHHFLNVWPYDSCLFFSGVQWIFLCYDFGFLAIGLNVVSKRASIHKPFGKDTKRRDEKIKLSQRESNSLTHLNFNRAFINPSSLTKVETPELSASISIPQPKFAAFFVSLCFRLFACLFFPFNHTNSLMKNSKIA